MRQLSTLRQDATGCEEKIAKIKAFAGAALLLHRSPEITLTVRNFESPAAAAVAGLAAELSHSGVALRIIICDAVATAPNAAMAVLQSLPGVAIRSLADPRYLDVHEQLVIGTSHAWVGDCMKRDPSKRDAFDMYRSDVKPSRHAAVSFNRLWRKAQPADRVASPNVLANHVAGTPLPVCETAMTTSL